MLPQRHVVYKCGTTLLLMRFHIFFLMLPRYYARCRHALCHAPRRGHAVIFSRFHFAAFEIIYHLFYFDARHAAA